VDACGGGPQGKRFSGHAVEFSAGFFQGRYCREAMSGCVTADGASPGSRLAVDKQSLVQHHFCDDLFRD
jgi:hypothetical protein